MKRILFAATLLFIATMAFGAPPRRPAAIDFAGTTTGTGPAKAEQKMADFPDGLPRVSRLQLVPTAGTCFMTLCENYQRCPSGGYNCAFDGAPRGCNVVGGPWIDGLGCECANC